MPRKFSDQDWAFLRALLGKTTIWSSQASGVRRSKIGRVVAIRQDALQPWLTEVPLRVEMWNPSTGRQDPIQGWIGGNALGQHYDVPFSRNSALHPSPTARVVVLLKQRTDETGSIVEVSTELVTPVWSLLRLHESAQA